MSRILALLAALSTATACASAPSHDVMSLDVQDSVLVAETPAKGVTGASQFVVHLNTAAELDAVQSAVAQVQVAVPFQLSVIEAGPEPVVGDNVWHIYFNQPCGLEVAPGEILCDPYTGAVDVSTRKTIWIATAAADARAIVAHEIGHAVGHYDHTEGGVMDRAANTEEFDDATLETIRELYR